MGEKLRLPSGKELVENLRALARKEESIARCLSALQTGVFRHPDGRVDELRKEKISPEQAGLLAYLATECPKPLSVEIGFGMGSSAAIILGARRLAGKPFTHLIYDPFGLPDGRGAVVQSFL